MFSIGAFAIIFDEGGKVLLSHQSGTSDKTFQVSENLEGLREGISL